MTAPDYTDLCAQWEEFRNSTPHLTSTLILIENTLAAIRDLEAKVPRFPDHMARIVEAKNVPLPDRIARLVAALEAIPEYMRQYEWQADEKQLFGSKWVRSVAGDNGKGMGRQAIAEVVNHIDVADFIAAASPDTIALLLAERAELIARAEAAEAKLAQVEKERDGLNAHIEGVAKDTHALLVAAEATVATLTAQVEAMRRELHTARLNAEALAEIKATLDGNSEQPVQTIMDGLLAELAALTTKEKTND